MIRYALRCSEEHDFESWFHSAEAYDTLAAARKLSCPVCGVTLVAKAPMAPPVKPSRAVPRRERAMAQLKAKLEAEAQYVGSGFATEARAIHDGDAPRRLIYGEAKLEEARALLEDGIPVSPLPFAPVRKTN